MNNETSNFTVSFYYIHPIPKDRLKCTRKIDIGYKDSLWLFILDHMIVLEDFVRWDNCPCGNITHCESCGFSNNYRVELIKKYEEDFIKENPDYKSFLFIDREFEKADEERLKNMYST